MEELDCDPKKGPSVPYPWNHGKWPLIPSTIVCWLSQCIHLLHGYSSKMASIVSTWVFNGPAFSIWLDKFNHHIWNLQFIIPILIHVWWLNQIPCWLFESQWFLLKSNILSSKSKFQISESPILSLNPNIDRLEPGIFVATVPRKPLRFCPACRGSHSTFDLWQLIGNLGRIIHGSWENSYHGFMSTLGGCLVVHPTNRKWVITLAINGISGVSPLITGVITHQVLPK